MGMEIDSLYWKVKLKVDELDRDIAAVKAKMGGLNQGVQKETDKTSAYIKKIGAAAAAYFSIQTFTNLISSIGRVRGEFQKYDAVLTNTLGSKGKAQEALSQIQKFAAETPFQITELTSSFVKLANQGFTPTIQQMKQMGDLASSVGKGYDQLTEAILDAAMGEWERMKEFGIKARQEGDKVTVTFKGQSVIIDNTAASIRNYILSLGSMKGVSGALEGISQTIVGMKSNLQDTWDMLLNNIGKRSEGLFAGALQSAQKLVGWLAKINEVKGSDELSKQNMEFKVLTSLLTNANTSQAHRRDLIDEINRKYADYLPNLLTEKSSMDEIKSAIDLANISMSKRIEMLSLEEEYNQLTQDALEKRKTYQDMLLAQEKMQQGDKAGANEILNQYMKDQRGTWLGFGKKTTFGERMALASTESDEAIFKLEEFQRKYQKILSDITPKSDGGSGDDNKGSQGSKAAAAFQLKLAQMKAIYQDYENYKAIWPADADRDFKQLAEKDFRSYLEGLVTSIKDPEMRKVLANALADLPKTTVRVAPPTAIAGKTADKVELSQAAKKAYDEELKMTDKLALSQVKYADAQKLSIGQLQKYITYLKQRYSVIKNINDEEAKKVGLAVLSAKQEQAQKIIELYDQIAEEISKVSIAMANLGVISEESAQQLNQGVKNVSNALKSKSVGEGFAKFAIQVGIDALNYYAKKAQEKLEAESKIFQNEIKKIQDSVDLIDYSTGLKRNEQYLSSLRQMGAEIVDIHQAIKGLGSLGVSLEGITMGRRGGLTDKIADINKAIQFWENIDAGEKKKEKKKAAKNLEKLEALKKLLYDYQDLLNEYYSGITGTTAETISDSIRDGLEGGFKTVADFADDTKSVIRKALMEAFQTKYLDEQVQQWFTAFGVAASDGLDKDEAAKSKAALEALISNSSVAFEEYRKMMEELGVWQTDTSDKASGIKGSFQGMSENTAEALVGQFGAIRFHILEGLELMKQGIIYQKETAINTRRLANIESHLALMASNINSTNRSNGR
jgi:hypothetical protein